MKEFVAFYNIIDFFLFMKLINNSAVDRNYQLLRTIKNIEMRLVHLEYSQLELQKKLKLTLIQ